MQAFVDLIKANRDYRETLRKEKGDTFLLYTGELINCKREEKLEKSILKKLEKNTVISE